MPVDDSALALTNSFGTIFLVVAVLGLTGFVIVIVSRARKLARVMKSSSSRMILDDELPGETESTARGTDSRLATLDTLMMQGKITPDEYRDARAKVLGEL